MKLRVVSEPDGRRENIKVVIDEDNSDNERKYIEGVQSIDYHADCDGFAKVYIKSILPVVDLQFVITNDQEKLVEVAKWAAELMSRDSMRTILDRAEKDSEYYELLNNLQSSLESLGYILFNNSC